MADDDTLQHWAEGGTEIVQARESLDLYTAAALRSLVLDLIQRRNRYDLIIDLGRTRFMDATGLAVLVGALKRVRAHDGRLSVACDYEPILRVFRTTGLTKVLDIHPGVEAALEARRTVEADHG